MYLRKDGSQYLDNTKQKVRSEFGVERGWREKNERDEPCSSLRSEDREFFELCWSSK